MKENTVGTSENHTTPLLKLNEARNTKNNLWMADLYVSRQKANLANAEAHYLERSNRYDYGAYRALDIAKKVEREFMTRPDFEKIRTMDESYLQLVEEFAMEVGSDLLSRGMRVDSTPISYVAKEQFHNEQAKKFRQRANKIASEHNTPKEKAEYIVFALRSFIREIVKGRYIQPNKPGLSKGVTQLLTEMEELNKQKGKYIVAIGDAKMTETITRLDALGKRFVYNVSPITPTPPFLTQEPPNNLDAMFRLSLLKK